jgi:hypothetical protein
MSDVNHPQHQPPPLPPEIRAVNKRNLVWGLVLGFLPTVMVLLAVTYFSAGGKDVSQTEARPLIMTAFIFTLCCSVGSSFLLFRRFKKGAALAGVILLLLINGGMAFFFGCCAVIMSN